MLLAVSESENWFATTSLAAFLSSTDPRKVVRVSLNSHSHGFIVLHYKLARSAEVCDDTHCSDLAECQAIHKSFDIVLGCRVAKAWRLATIVGHE